MVTDQAMRQLADMPEDVLTVIAGRLDLYRLSEQERAEVQSRLLASLRLKRHIATL